MRLTLTFCLVVLSFGLSAKLAPHTPAPLFEHLAEVNARWLYETGPADYLTETTFAHETDRIRRHLLAVHGVLSQRNTEHLNADRRSARETSLRSLLAYAQRGRFPINTGHSERTPYFVDADDTHCAVGYLMHTSGADETVRAIRTRTNNGYVLEDLLSFPAIGEWAHANGFTAEELAWIQPGYPGTYLLRPQPFGNNLGVKGGEVFAGEVTADYGLFVAGDFDSFDGLQCEGFVQVADGLPAAVDNPFARIDQLTLLPDSTRMLCYGVAADAADSMQVSVFDASEMSFTGAWRFAAGTQMYAHVDTTDFLVLATGTDGSDTAAIRLHRLGVDAMSLQTLPADGFTLRGRINDSYAYGGSITFGGTFTAYDSAGQPIDSNQVRYDLARHAILEDNNASMPASGGNSVIPVNRPVFEYRYASVDSFNGNQYFTVEYLSPTAGLDSLLVHSIDYDDGEDLMMEARFSSSGGVLIKGTPSDIRVLGGFERVYSGNIAPLRSASPIGDETQIIVSSGPVLVGLVYETQVPADGQLRAWLPATAGFESDSILVAGTFTSLSGETVNQLAWAKPFVSDADEPRAPEARVFAARDGLRIEFEEVPSESATLFLYASDGRLVQESVLPQGQQQYTVSVGSRQAILHYALQTERGVRAGTVAMPAR